MARGRAKGRTNNPKFVGGPAGQQNPMSGQNVGGLTDAQARANAAMGGHMLSRQLKKNKSAGMRPPGR